MPGVPFTARSTTVQVLTGIALVLFCLVFLRFVSLTFGQDVPRQAAFVATFEEASLAGPAIMEAQRALDEATRRFEQVQRQMKRRRCGYEGRYQHLREAKEAMLTSKRRLLNLQQQRQRAATVQRELKLRALQRPEVDETLRNRLGMGAETAPIPIMQ